MFKIVIFTASQSIYAEQLLDILDPDKRIISQRVYRESCIFSDGSYTKDLTILGVDLAKVVIIDNSPQVFISMLQLDYVLLFFSCMFKYLPIFSGITFYEICVRMKHKIQCKILTNMMIVYCSPNSTDL